jgi:HPt (histidine-containing phosphotransfer) domain-containing protein
MTMPPPLPPPVDDEVLEMLASLQEPGEPDLLTELVTLFLRDTPVRLRDLEQRPLDPQATARVAHALKGSAGNLGASHLQELASRLEQAGRRGASADMLATMADALCAEYARVAAYLETVVAGRGDATA